MEYTDIILDIITPEGTLVHKNVGRVELPGTMGRFMVLKDHAPLITALVKGEIVYGPGEDKDDETVGISSGFVEICGNHVTACVEL